MPTDHPDGTRPIVISRADIKMPTDFQHQTINLKTNFKEQEVGVYLQPEWAAKKEIDKNLEIIECVIEDDDTASIDYPVGAGKTLYLTHYSVSISGDTRADRELPQIVEAYIAIGGPPWSYYGIAGGNGGVVQAFTKPVVIDGGETVWLIIHNRAGHSAKVWGSCCGYEI